MTLRQPDTSMCVARHFCSLSFPFLLPPPFPAFSLSIQLLLLILFPWNLVICFLSLWLCLFSIIKLHGTFAFCVWLLLLSIIRFFLGGVTHIVTGSILHSYLFCVFIWVDMNKWLFTSDRAIMTDQRNNSIKVLLNEFVGLLELLSEV